MWSHIKLIQNIKENLPEWLKVLLIRFVYIAQILVSKLKSNESLNLEKKNNKAFVLLSTDYSNLGDHALTYAHIKFLEKNHPEFEIVEVLVSDTIKYIKDIKSNINPGDIITLKGGGNIGVEYFREELYRRFIIDSFPDNKIIIFPQTIYFGDSKFAQKQKRVTFDYFLKHNNLFVCTRDENSYHQLEPVLKNRAILTPDIVFSLGKISFASKEKKGAVTAFRDDIEGVFSQKQKAKIISILNEKFDSVSVSDTTTPYPISVDMRETELFKIWELFSSAELIVTDRLHGMIFAHLTSTPCIVLKTYNHKVTGQFDWIKDLGNTKLLTDFELFSSIIDSCVTTKPSEDISLIDNFDRLLRVID